MNLNPDILRFDQATHTYTVEGQEWPSVSRVMGPIVGDLDSIPRSVLDAKSELGTAIHLATELIDQNDLDDESVLPEWKGYIDAYRRFLSEHAVEWEFSEAFGCHEEERYAGTIDRAGSIDGESALVDIKTRVRIPGYVGVQLAAYEAMHPALRGRKRFALHLMPTGAYKLIPFQSPLDWVRFRACLTVMRARQELS